MPNIQGRMHRYVCASSSNDPVIGTAIHPSRTAAA